jgi:hypothetical protein
VLCHWPKNNSPMGKAITICWIFRLQQLLVYVVHWMGFTVLKDHTTWQSFMPLPANSLMQSARHVTAYVHIHFWMNTMLMIPAARNTDVMAFQHASTLTFHGFQ